MKKIIVWMMLFAVVLTCCACGKQQPQNPEQTQTQATTEATEETTKVDLSAIQSPEQMYGHIDQTQPVDGVYQIWNAEGVHNIAAHPDAQFKLLCDVDMGGAELTPIGNEAEPFTGKFIGGNNTISNFAVKGGEDGNFGFFGVNKGIVRDVILENVTFQPAENVKNAGALAGINAGELTRVNVYGTMTVSQAAEGVNCGSGVGINTGEIKYTDVSVDLKFTAPCSANVGGIVGDFQAGEISFVDTLGMLEVEGEGKQVGLFAGNAANAVLSDCVFLGAANTLNGELFINFTGNGDDDELAVALNAAYRVNDHHEPLTEAQNKVRDRVVEEMIAMATIEWHLHEGLNHTCTCTASSCNGVYNNSTTYVGIPYNHKGGSLSRMKYVLDEDGYIKDWLYDLPDYDGFDLYMGNDCSTSLIHAWWTVSNSVDFSRCQYMIPHRVDYPNVATGEETSGTIPIGDYNIDFTLNSKYWTNDYLNNNTEQEIYEAYGALRKGDAYVYINELGGHTRMATADAVVVRRQNGDIDPDLSYVLSTEQGATSRTETPEGVTHSSWRVNFKYTFANLYFDWAVPVSCEELLTGEMEPSTCQLLGGLEGYAGMYNGTVKANYYLDNVDLEIKNSKGEVVFFHTMWTTADRKNDVGHPDGAPRNYCDTFEMADFAMPLSQFQFEKGETYTYTVTGHLHTYEDFVVHESSFTYGTTH